MDRSLELSLSLFQDEVPIEPAKRVLVLPTVPPGLNPYHSDHDVILFHGDCRDILPKLGTEWADTVISDPPYGIDLQPQRRLTKVCINDTNREAKALWWSAMPLIYNAAKPDTAHILFSGWSEFWCQEVLDEWFTIKGCIVWKKNNFGIGYYLRPQWEPAYYLHKGNPPRPKVAESDVWEFSKEQAPDHSCQKPVALIQHAIEFCGGGVVLDPFVGSGTALVAARVLGLKAVGIELSEEHCELCVKRLSQKFLPFDQPELVHNQYRTARPFE